MTLFRRLLFCALFFITPTAIAQEVAPAAPLPKQHGISMFGALKYGPDFAHFDYVNPAAPKGGDVKLAATGGFDSLNPYILKGLKAPGTTLLFETLMTGSLDEPQSMYALIAENVSIAPDIDYAEFFINPKARWHDGTPITADDVVFSYETLKSKGDPTFKILLSPIAKLEKTGEHSVKYTFASKGNRESPMIAASIPVISKAYYTSHAFDKTTLEPPLGSGPYKIEKVDQGRSLTYTRVNDYWGKDLPVNKGQYNFDHIRYDVYRDETVALEALKAGEFDYHEENIARNWATAYDSPALKSGKLIKIEPPHQIPQGMQAFLFNTRLTKFNDRRVREAIGLTLDFEWVNKTIFYNAYERNKSYFENTEFAALDVPDAAEKAILEPFKDKLPEGLFTEKFLPPATDGSGENRAQLLKAQKLLEEAGWILKDGKRVHKDTGEVLTIEFLLRQASIERIIAPMRKHLKRLGIEASIRIVDDSQYQKRVENGEFDIVSIWYNRGVFYPGNEQSAYWHSSQADIKGSNNIGGLKHPAVDAALDKLRTAKTEAELVTAGRALDRILLWEQVAIPNWHITHFRVAYWDKFMRPDVTPKYAIGFNGWWIPPEKRGISNTP